MILWRERDAGRERPLNVNVYRLCAYETYGSLQVVEKIQISLHLVALLATAYHSSSSGASCNSRQTTHTKRFS